MHGSRSLSSRLGSAFLHTLFVGGLLCGGGVMVATAGCASAPQQTADAPLVPDQGKRPPPPPTNAYLDDVKDAVAAQLECPLDQVSMNCLRKDRQGECIAVRGDGCGRTVEYQFGEL